MICGINNGTGVWGQCFGHCYRARTGNSGTSGETSELNAGRPGYLETATIGSIDTLLADDEGSGVSQAVGALVFRGGVTRTVSRIAAYVIQDGAGTGSFQMAVLQPVSNSIAVVLTVTAVVTSITSGILVLPLTSAVTMTGNSSYYLAVYNQVDDSKLGAVSAGLSATQDAPPINFRIQNIAGFTVGSLISTSDVSLQISPWLAVF